MNAVNPTAQGKGEDAKVEKPSEPKPDVAKKADQAKPDEAPAEPADVDAAEKGEDVTEEPVTVTLQHPTDEDATVEVLKPSTDYTNYVRGYGYQEV